MEKGGEGAFGITARVYPEWPVISGYTIKKYPGDFVVQEIDLQGNPVEFDESLPSEEDPKQEEQKTKASVEEISVLDADVKNEIKEFLADDSAKEYIIKQQVDKEVRKKVHFFFKENYARDFTTDTVNLGEGPAIRIRRNQLINFSNSPSEGVRRDYASSNAFYTFTLCKVNYDTLSAVDRIAKACHLNPKYFSFAGNKDRRAVTLQQVRVRGLPNNNGVKRLLGFNKITTPFNPFQLSPEKATLRSVRVGSVKKATNEQDQKALSFGDLFGNRFTLIIRNLPTASKADIEARIKSIQTTGFANFFGQQRFGTNDRCRTHTIGILLLRGEWEKACRTILETAFQLPAGWETNPSLALSVLPQSAQAEQAILGHFFRQNAKPADTMVVLSDWRGAVGAIPRELRLIYVHAVQSFIWNRVLSLHIVKKDKCDEGCLGTELPIPGYDTKFEDNFFEDAVWQTLNELGLERDCFTPTPQNERLWDLPGGSRAALVKPTNVSHDWIEDDATTGSALKLAFSLPSSAYATVFLRELFGN